MAICTVHEFWSCPMTSGQRNEFQPLMNVMTAIAATKCSELGTTTRQETLVRYAGGPLAGGAALTRNRHGQGTAYYLTTHLAGSELSVLLGRLAAGAGAHPPLPEVPAGVDVVARRHPDGRTYVFVANDGESDVDLAVPGEVLTGGTPLPGAAVRVPAGGMAVVRSQRAATAGREVPVPIADR